MTMKEDVLDRVRIASPCSVSWESMNGNEQARFCSQCKLHVYDISKLTRGEAVALLAKTDGRICARLYRRADGTLLTRDCPVGLRALRRRVARFAGAGLAIVLSLFSTVAAQKRSPDKNSCKDIPAFKIERKELPGQRGIVRGKVLDPNGAVVAGAKLSLVSEVTKVKLAAVSTDFGEFVIPEVGIGEYTLEIEAQGFKAFRLTNLVVGKGEELRVAVTLQVLESTMGIVDLPISEPIMSPPGTMILSGDMIRRLPH